MPNPKWQDETLFCERCGISFLWSIEEQKQQATQNESAKQSPIYCPGCRHLLPATGRERGLVKWYNVRKHYGFITRRSAPELYVHSSQLQEQRRLQPGDLVEFSVGTNERGPMAEAVQLLGREQESV